MRIQRSKTSQTTKVYRPLSSPRAYVLPVHVCIVTKDENVICASSFHWLFDTQHEKPRVDGIAAYTICRLSSSHFRYPKLTQACSRNTNVMRLYIRALGSGQRFRSLAKSSTRMQAAIYPRPMNSLYATQQCN